MPSMKIDIIHLFKYFEYSNMVYPIVLDVLKVWANSAGWQARVVVGTETDVDVDTKAEVVAISTYTQTAPAAYRLASALRSRGKIVILGGPHFRGQNYREALRRCDIVVNTIHEAQWRDVLQRIASGDLRPDAKRPAMCVNDREGLFRYPRNFFETFKSQKWYQISSVPTSLGCPYECNFCSAYLQGKYLLRDIDTIVQELEHVRGSWVFLCDATFGLNKKFTLELMAAIAPLKKNILIETTLLRLKDRELMDGLQRGGVKWISVGIESLSLRMNKHGSTDLEQGLNAVVKGAHDRGMLVQGNFICGLDCDGPDSFDRIYDFYGNTDLDLVILDLLTPYPNTELYNELEASGRIVDYNWEHYDYRHVVYQPKNMSRCQLLDGFTRLYERVTSLSCIASKALGIYRHNGINLRSSAFVFYNLFSRYDARRKERLLRAGFDDIVADNMYAVAADAVDAVDPGYLVRIRRLSDPGPRPNQIGDHREERVE